ncbi:MFS transporter [Gorillibacterium sp. sgz5001074]|uniref:MFS transporter n=1 Tax=Gorillibacterium sp. sgz5001074 TaxID=3446695 RepID=UPI003F67C973
MRKQIAVLRGLTSGYYATQAILLPLLPLYFANLGYSSQETGLFMMIGPFVTVFAQPMWGYISDRLQKLRIIILSLWLLTIASSVLLFHANTFMLTFLSVLLCYFFMLPSVPLLDSIILKSTAEAKVPYGSVRLWGSVGFTIVAVLSGFALNALGGITNIKYMYWTVWLIPLSLIYLLQDVKSDGKRPRVTLGSLKAVTGNKPFLWFLLLVFVLTVPHRMNDALFSLYLQEMHADNWMVSLAWALAAGSEIPTFALLSRYMHKFHELALLGAAAMLFTVRWLVYASVHDPWVLTFMQLTHSVTYAPFWVVAVQYTVRLVPEEFRATGQSMLSAVFLGIAGITGGFFGGRIGDLWGYGAAYRIGAGMAFLAGIGFLVTHAVYRRRSTMVLEGD